MSIKSTFLWRLIEKRSGAIVAGALVCWAWGMAGSVDPLEFYLTSREAPASHGGELQLVEKSFL